MTVLLRNGITLEEALKENASIVDNYYYLPCWFELREDKVFMHHINDIPQELKDLIIGKREGINISSYKKHLDEPLTPKDSYEKL